jgi:hypothetical protein
MILTIKRDNFFEQFDQLGFVMKTHFYVGYKVNFYILIRRSSEFTGTVAEYVDSSQFLLPSETRDIT